MSAWTEVDMRLPSGMTCGDCRQHARCRALFGCSALNTSCDFSPSRFVPVQALPHRVCIGCGAPAVEGAPLACGH